MEKNSVDMNDVERELNLSFDRIYRLLNKEKNYLAQLPNKEHEKSIISTERALFVEKADLLKRLKPKEVAMVQA